VQKWQTGHRRQYNTAHAPCVLGNYDFKHILRICYTYCFSTPSMVTWTRLDVELYARVWPVLFGHRIIGQKIMNCVIEKNLTCAYSFFLDCNMICWCCSDMYEFCRIFESRITKISMRFWLYSTICRRDMIIS